MKILVPGILLLIALLLPLAVNFFGTNIFLYLGPPGRQVVIAASCGVCHLAITTESHGYESVVASFADYGVLPAHRQILKFGSVDLFTEARLDPMYWMRFDLTRGTSDFDYSAVEFPWLLVPLAPVAFLVLLNRRKSKPGKKPE